ncbi:MAG: 1-phosphofructokinase [Firmicutes bacterium]|nr:1-phosphofructokinase [Bacillota bacterium]
MIATVTLNAALDKSYQVENFCLDKVNRVKDVVAVPGGKGVNVAKVANTLGREVTASGFLGGSNGRYIDQCLLKLGIYSDFVWVKGDTRETIAIIDKGQKTQTELLEPGPVISQTESESMKIKVQALAHKSNVIVFSGSMPRGLEPGFYAKILQIAKDAGVLTILDTSGQSLSKGLSAAPFMCKPNIDEISHLLGYTPSSTSELVSAAKHILENGVELAVVSLGKDGALAVTEKFVWQITLPSIQVVNTVGCGDALVAGCAAYFDKLNSNPCGLDIENALRLGTAAALSNALSPWAGEVKNHEVKDFTAMLGVKKL